MKTAVVILNWNGLKLLNQFLPSIVKNSGNADIYVADNASDDGSVAFVKKYFPTVRIVENESNLGFAKGYNEALKHVDADIFALVNSDVEVSENWLEPIISRFEKQREIAIIQPKIRDFKRKDFFEYAGAAGGFIDTFGYAFCRGRIFETVEKDIGQYDDSCEIFWASGACFLIRSAVFRELNGFDESFFAHQEEIDLCWRANIEKHKIQYEPKSVVFHVGGATLQDGNPQKTFLNFRNSLLMLLKNVPAQQLWKVLTLRICLDALAGIRFLFQGKPRHTVAILKAHWSFYALFRATYRKRKPINLPKYRKLESIAYAYFLQKKTRFKDLF